MVSVSIENTKCYDSNDCCDGYTCVRARRLKDKFSKKLHLSCKRRHVNGNKKYSGCCKQKGSYSPFSFKRYKLPDKKMSKGDFGFRQSENTGNIQFLYPSEAERKELRDIKAQLCNEPQSRRSPTKTRSATSVRSPTPSPTRRNPTRRSPTRRRRPTTTRNLSVRSPTPSPKRRNPTRRNPTRRRRPTTTRNLSVRSPTRRRPTRRRPTRRTTTRPDQALSKIKSKINPKSSRKEEVLRQISLNNAVVLHLLNENGERQIPFGRLTLENEDNKFEKCGNINGGITRCKDPNYSICAKARRRFQNSLKSKHSEKPQFENCLTPPKESGEIKIHRNKGCCISKKEYGLGIQYKRLKNKKKFLKI
jgi:hypothetical protein